MFRNLKENVHRDVPVASPKQQLINFVGLIIIVAAAFVFAKFGPTAAIVFGVVAVGAGIFVGRRFNL